MASYYNVRLKMLSSANKYLCAGRRGDYTDCTATRSEIISEWHQSSLPLSEALKTSSDGNAIAGYLQEQAACTSLNWAGTPITLGQRCTAMAPCSGHVLRTGHVLPLSAETSTLHFCIAQGAPAREKTFFFSLHDLQLVSLDNS